MPIESIPGSLPPAQLHTLIAALFAAEGVSLRSAEIVAHALVAADISGKASHGVMLVPMYLARMKAGSVTCADEAEVVHDGKTTLVLDAANALGQLSAHQACHLATARAREYGLAMVTVRNAFHFGEAGYWARRMADAGCVGIAMANTRPLMPAPGGAQRRVGNNPLAIAMPHTDDIPVVLDMAMSASAMGKIRLAERAGKTLPNGWATDAQGVPTQDPATAIAGMLLPAAGPKGFGLAFMVDLLCGGLSDGAVGGEVQPLYGDNAIPYGSAQAFLAIDASHFGLQRPLAQRASDFARTVRESTPAPGIERVFSPGEQSWQFAQDHCERCPVSLDTAKQLTALAREAGIDVPAEWQSL
ncbi:Ureidoglycolate dehydrogenase (NAD(+)) [Pandoraea pneumonica]|jgi:LDH2 family malate/lactate/ureidoglycolate dehydrogenase|uniref:Ureidoglycolate dehydrogenase (NAD(+)) n=1 Tax=Pandoraea pneumonica TaxID=2508299 RepID=A0A5E4VNI4_9BURK|nr:Ldh family oxidoreductase [Pandoraea pneumonica]VVE13908.1 Ureidoglycolate dehydrogenase (NAD(+)) [Pandoraea pneumonica]